MERFRYIHIVYKRLEHPPIFISMGILEPIPWNQYYRKDCSIMWCLKILNSDTKEFHFGWLFGLVALGKFRNLSIRLFIF